MGYTSGFNKESMVEKIKDFWNYKAIPVLQTFYYIARYGLKGASKMANKRLARLRKEFIDVTKNQKR